MENIDDLIAQIVADELCDAIEESDFATPTNYARARGITPQSVYYHIRAGHLTKERCACGRWVITVSEADKIFRRTNEGRTVDQGNDQDASGNT